MRVLHIIDRIDQETGGPAMSLSLLAQALRAHGVEVKIVVARSTGTLTPVDGVETFVGQDQLAAQVDAADVCHIHGVWDPIVHSACTACRRVSRPFIVRTCGMLDPWCLRQGWLKKRLYRIARLDGHLRHGHALHCTSGAESTHVQQLGLNDRIIVEPNGVDFQEFDALPPPGTFRASHDLGTYPIVLFLGRLHAVKGLDVLLDAWSRVKNTSAMLVLAGPDEAGYRAVLERQIDALKLTDRVRLTGMLNADERLGALVDADLFVLPSYHENFGVSVVEALAAGTPAIVSDQVNVHDEIVNAGAGAAVVLGPQALCDAIETWLADAALRADAGNRAAALARDRYDWAKIAGRWVDHYAAIASGGGH